MRRSVWVALALIALGLWASLFPQVTYPSSSSGDPDGDVLTAWPGWSVQQELGSLTGTVGTFRIWVSADPTAFADVTLNASLIDASTREVLRQALVTVSRRYIPAAHTVTFPGYAIPPGQRLMLQFGVPEAQDRHVIYRLANPHPGQPNVMLNGVPNARLNGAPGSRTGPLAVAHMRTGSGLRAAIDGHLASRLHLALAIGSAALAVLAYPPVARNLGHLVGAARRHIQQARRRVGRAIRIEAGPEPGGPPSRLQRGLTTPWYPWPVAVVPILHYLASNPLHFAVTEAIVPLAVVLAAVTIVVVGLRVALKDWHRSAAACTALVVGFFGYGHVAGVLEDRLDHRLIFALAVVLTAILAGLIVRPRDVAGRTTPFLNLAAAILVSFSVISLAADAARLSGQGPSSESDGSSELAEHLLPAGTPELVGPHPDIYYIILDAYSRHDALLDLYGFDNTEFLRDLERRGFHVARAATSNYNTSIHSIPSSLNMAYLHKLGSRIPASQKDLVDLSRSNALAAILRELRYEYIHLESGYISTNSSPLADYLVSFTPSGTHIRPGDHYQTSDLSTHLSLSLSENFVEGLLQTTALSSILRQGTLKGQSSPYEWHSSQRALRMLSFFQTRRIPKIQSLSSPTSSSPICRQHSTSMATILIRDLMNHTTRAFRMHT